MPSITGTFLSFAATSVARGAPPVARLPPNGSALPPAPSALSALNPATPPARTISSRRSFGRARPVFATSAEICAPFFHASKDSAYCASSGELAFAGVFVFGVATISGNSTVTRVFFGPLTRVCGWPF
jgi:hypothetical protein